MITTAELAGDTLAVVLAAGPETGAGQQAPVGGSGGVSLRAVRRNINFTLLNLVNSEIRHIAITISADAVALVRQLRETWSDVTTSAGGYIETWTAGECLRAGGHGGSAEALYRNLQAFSALDASIVLVLPGDRVRPMDYRPLLERHVRCRADVTIACDGLDRAESVNHGLIRIGRRFRVQQFSIGPAASASRSADPGVFASAGIVAFEEPFLERLLLRDACSRRSHHDLEADILPRAIRDGRVFAYPLDDPA